MDMYFVHIAILFVQPSGLSKGCCGSGVGWGWGGVGWGWGGVFYACADRLRPKHEGKQNWLGFMVTIQRDEGPQQTPSTGLREGARKRCSECGTTVPAKYGLS